MSAPQNKGRMSLTPNECENKRFPTLKSDKRAEEKSSENFGAKCSLLKYASQMPIMVATEKSGYFVRHPVGDKNNIMTLSPFSSIQGPNQILF